jgi:hypothetical protein
MIAIAALLAVGCGDDDSSNKSESTTKETTMTSPADTPPDTPPEAPAEEKPAAPEVTTFTASIENGQPAGGPQIWRASKGDKVRIVVTSDTADELHLHEPYDISKDVEAGGSATLEFVADISGSTELELEDAGVLIGNLEVR